LTKYKQLKGVNFFETQCSICVRLLTAETFLSMFTLMWLRQLRSITIQVSAAADKPARRATSRRTCCKQVRWTLNLINLRPS